MRLDELIEKLEAVLNDRDEGAPPEASVEIEYEDPEWGTNRIDVGEVEWTGDSVVLR